MIKKTLYNRQYDRPKIFHKLRSSSTVSKCPENNRHSARCSNHEFKVSDGPRLEITYLEQPGRVVYSGLYAQ